MPLLPRKGRDLPYDEQLAKAANLRRVEVLVTPLFGFENDKEHICGVGRAVWESAPRETGRALALDLDPWLWLRQSAADGYRIGERVATGKIALFTDGWRTAVYEDPTVEPLSGLRSPPPEIAVSVFAAALSSLLQIDQRFPLFVQRNSAYHVSSVLATMADRLLELSGRGVDVDSATLRLAQAVARG